MDPTRLLLSDKSSESEREILAAYDRGFPAEAAGSEAKRKVLALATSTAAFAAAAKLVSASSIAPKGVASSVVLFKWLGFGILVVGGVGVVALARQSRVTPMAFARPVASANDPVAPPEPLVGPTGADLPAMDFGATPHTGERVSLESAGVDLTELPIAAASPHAPAIRPGEGRGDASDLAAEVEALDAVRAALLAGASPRALALLDTFDVRTLHPNLAEESAALRIEALAKSGRTADARDLLRRFAARYPASPYASRLHAFVEPP